MFIVVRPQTQETNIRIIGMCATFPADRPGDVMGLRDTLGSGPVG